MVVTVASLIASARAYANDDHAQVQGAIPDARWLVWANIEWNYVYHLLLDYSLIAPPTTVLSGTPVSGQLSVPGCLGIEHVYRVDGDNRTLLTPAQSGEGRSPYRSYTGDGEPTEWWATGGGGAVTVTLNPPTSTGTYEVRYVPEAPELVLSAPVGTQVTSIDVNPTAHDLIAMRMANKQLIRLNGYSGNLSRSIKEAQEELQMQSVARHPGAHVVKNLDPELRGWRGRVGELERDILWFF